MICITFRIMYGQKGTEAGLAKHLVEHKKMYEPFFTTEVLDFEKNVKLPSGKIKTVMVKAELFYVKDIVGFKNAVLRNRGFTDEDKIIQKVNFHKLYHCISGSVRVAMSICLCVKNKFVLSTQYSSFWLRTYFIRQTEPKILRPFGSDRSSRNAYVFLGQRAIRELTEHSEKV